MSKIYISDLDGTLLQNDGTISKYTREKLKILIKNDVKFTVASARSVISIQKILVDIPIKLPIIEFNGAFISNLKTGEHLIINEINKDYTKEILEIIKKNNKMPFISSFNGTQDCLYYSKIINEGMDYYLNNRIQAYDNRLRKLTNLEESLNENIVCYTIIDEKERLTNVINEIRDKYPDELELHEIENQYSPGWCWFTIHDKKATKDQAIQHLLKILNSEIDNLTVFGDNLNDIKMFKLVSRSVAVKNASEELKKYASDITDTNENDGVVKFILNDLKMLNNIL